MKDVPIRPARSNDCTGIRDVAERGWNEAYSDFLEQATIDAAIDEWYTVDALHERIQDDDVYYLVAEHDERVVGFVSGVELEEEEATAALSSIYVDPDTWSEGIGTAMLERFEAWCRDRDCEAVQIRAFASNERAVSFYRAHGYQVIDNIESVLYGQPVTDCKLCREFS